MLSVCKVRLPFDCSSTALRPSYVTAHQACSGLLHCGLNNKQVSATAASGLRHCDLNDLW